MRAAVLGVLILCATVLTPGAASQQEDKNMDREAHGLRGPVKSCVTEVRYDTEGVGPTVETEEFDQQGRLVGKTSKYPGHDEWSTTYTFDEHGRLLGERSSKGGTTTSESVNSYDNAGRLTKVTMSGGMQGDVTRNYEYDAEDRVVAIVETGKRGEIRADFRYENGRKTMVKTVPPQDSGMGYAATGADGLMEAAMSGSYGPPKGGTVAVSFDEHDRPVEAKLANPQGTVHTRIVRTYDAQGRIVETRSIMEDPFAMLGADIPKEVAAAEAAQLEPMKAAIRRMVGGKTGAISVSYKFDKQGRMLERNSTGMGSEHKQFMEYNEHGDLVSEKTDMSTDPDAVTGISTDEMGNIVETKGERHSLMHSETKIEYLYDSFGNWTEKTAYVKASPEEEFKRTMVMRRTITYY